MTKSTNWKEEEIEDMNLDDLINHTGEWLKGTGPNSSIVMSSRIRLARNLTQLPFPNKANKKDC